MKKTVLLLSLTCLSVLMTAQLVFSQNDEKSTLIGNPTDSDAAASIVADNAGNTYVGGKQNNKGLIVKQDPLHVTLWSKTLAFTNNPDDVVNILFLDLVGDTVFGCGVISGVSSLSKGAFYFKMNAQTGAMYWSKFELVSTAGFFCMRYANGKFFLIGGTLGVSSAPPPATSGKVMAVSSQTGAVIWETPLLHYFIPSTSSPENRTSFFSATEMVNGKLYITGYTGPIFSSIGTSGLQMPLLIGVSETGTVFLEKYFSVPAAAQPYLGGAKIHYDMNQNLVLACHFYSYYNPNNLVLIKFNPSGNMIFCKYYTIDNDALINVAAFNETATNYVVFGSTFGSVDGTYVLKVAKNGTVESCIGVSKPNVLPDFSYVFSYDFSGNSAFLNGKHYFVSTEQVSWEPSDINQIILNEDLDVVEDCSEIVDLSAPVTNVTATLNSLMISHVPNTLSFQNGALLEDVPSFTYCDSISLDLVQTTGCNPLTLTANVAGFYTPTFYWSTGDTTTINSLSVNSTDTVFLRVLDTKCCELFDTIVPAFVASNMSAGLPADTTLCLQIGGSLTITPTVSNTNFPLHYLWSDSSTLSSLSVTVSGTYWVEVSDGCLIQRDSIDIVINFLPDISNTVNIAVCEGDFPATLNPIVSSGASVLWDDGTPTIQRSVNGPGSYTIAATNSCGTTTATLVVSQTNLPDVSLPVSIDTCVQNGGSIVLTPTLNNVDTVLWSNGSPGNQLTVSTSGTYVVYGSNVCGIDSASILVGINSLPIIGNTTNIIVCEDDFPAILSPVVSSGASVLWDDGTPTTQRSVNGPGSYTIAATNSCGTTTATLVVSQTNLPDVSLPASIDTCVQNGGSIVLTPTLNNVNTVLWSNGSPGNQLTVSASGNYTVFGSNVCGIDSASCSVTINHFPELDLPATLDTCFEIGVGFSFTAQGSPGSYQWSSGSQTATEWISQEGIYSCTLTNQCGNITDSMRVSRTIVPDLYFPEDSIRYCEHQLSVSLLHIETNYNLEIFAPYHGMVGTYLSETGLYLIHVFNGCWHKWDSIYVDLQNEQFYLPNSFTPNGDLNNDRFEFKGENIVIREIRIFNRWGEEVFSQAGNFTGWDGHFQGEVCPDGMYAVHVIYEDCFGMPTEFSGHVNLLR